MENFLTTPSFFPTLALNYDITSLHNLKLWDFENTVFISCNVIQAAFGAPGRPLRAKPPDFQVSREGTSWTLRWHPNILRWGGRISCKITPLEPILSSPPSVCVSLVTHNMLISGIQQHCLMLGFASPYAASKLGSDKSKQNYIWINTLKAGTKYDDGIMCKKKTKNVFYFVELETDLHNHWQLRDFSIKQTSYCFPLHQSIFVLLNLFHWFRTFTHSFLLLLAASTFILKHASAGQGFWLCSSCLVSGWVEQMTFADGAGSLYDTVMTHIESQWSLWAGIWPAASSLCIWTHILNHNSNIKFGWAWGIFQHV